MASENGHHVPGTPDTYRHGWLPLIHKSDLSTPDARRSPEVTPEEFQKYAKRGQAKLAVLDTNSQIPQALQGPAWQKTVDDAFTATREPWGGVTVDAHTGEHVAPDADKYALTVRDKGRKSVHVSPSAGKDEFADAMQAARARFKNELRRGSAHLGVFRDEDTGNIDIDPVLVTSKLSDVHDIGAYSHATGGAYHFKSGDGYWPPHVPDQETDMSNILTPVLHSGDLDLARRDGKFSFWKQILPKRRINYTAKDGSRQQIDFDDAYLADLAKNKAVDKIGFLLADKDNAHTMDPERWRGEVDQMEVRDDGLYGHITFGSAEAAKAVLDNPDLGVSARIREGVARSDGSTLSRGIIHILGTLDPQIEGMKPWETADLSNEGDLLDLSHEEYTDMAEKKSPEDYTEADIDAMTEAELDAFLAENVPGFVADDEAGTKPEVKPEVEAEVKVPVGADLSNEISLANEQTARANARANEALRRVADAEWREERSALLGEGVPPFALDLAAPVLNRADDMVIDLSNEDGKDVNVSAVVRGLLDSMKGMIDLSAPAGHVGVHSSGDADPDAALLALWDRQF